MMACCSTFFSYQRTLGFVHRTHLRLTLYMRVDVSSVSQKLLTTSLVVTCDSVNFLLGNHTKSFDKVIFTKLIFIFSRKNVACFLCLLIILKCTLDCFYDGSKHNEFRTELQLMSRTKNPVQGSILWNQGHIMPLQCTMFTS